MTSTIEEPEEELQKLISQAQNLVEMFYQDEDIAELMKKAYNLGFKTGRRYGDIDLQ